MSTDPAPAEDAARQAGELKALLDAAVDAVIVIDRSGKIEVFNTAAERMFGRSADEVAGRNVNLLMPEPYRSEHDSYLARYLATGEARIIGIGREVHAQRADGTIFSVRLSVGRIGGNPPRFVGIVHDISRQKAIEAELKRERDRTQSYLDLAEVMLLALDAEGCITLINRKGCEILEAEESELLGRDWFEHFVPPYLRAEIRDVYARVIAGDVEADIYENRVCTMRGRERRIAWRNRRMTDETGRVIGTLSCGEDVTERRQAEEEAQRARDRLTHVSRLSTMGEMTAGLAHEINQPLTAIASYAQACQRLLASHDNECPPEFKAALEQISTQALRAGEVIRRLRSLVRDRQSHREIADANQLVQITIVLADADARANDIQIALDLADEPLPVRVDQVQIQQVLLNLIRNAIDASEELQSDRRVVIATRRAADRIEVAVIDHGCGLPDGAGDELFNPFYTSKPSGTGLGLSISRSIVRAHGGRLSFRRHEDGPGTTFLFTLPVFESSEENG